MDAKVDRDGGIGRRGWKAGWTEPPHVQIAQQQEMTAVTRQGAQNAIAAANGAMNERSRISHDWADIALDQQKRMDPKTGEIAKDSSLYSYTWVNRSEEHTSELQSLRHLVC